jgi:hypothetical protein
VFLSVCVTFTHCLLFNLCCEHFRPCVSHSCLHCSSHRAHDLYSPTLRIRSAIFSGVIFCCRAFCRRRAFNFVSGNWNKLPSSLCSRMTYFSGVRVFGGDGKVTYSIVTSSNPRACQRNITLAPCGVPLSSSDTTPGAGPAAFAR